MGASQTKRCSRVVEMSELMPGDILLFAAKTRRFLYHVRHCKYLPYTNAAFVICSEGNDVQLCGHFADTLQPGNAAFRNLSAEIRSGQYHAVYVRPLLHNLTLESITAVMRFAEEAVGEVNLEGPTYRDDKPWRHDDEEVAVVMAATEQPAGLLPRISVLCSTPVEHFTTSRLIAEMLLHAGQVINEGHTYLAATADEGLLAPVCELELYDSKK